MDSNYDRPLPKSTLIGQVGGIAIKQKEQKSANEEGLNRHERRKEKSLNRKRGR